MHFTQGQTKEILSEIAQKEDDLNAILKMSLGSLDGTIFHYHKSICYKKTPRNFVARCLDIEFL